MAETNAPRKVSIDLSGRGYDILIGRGVVDSLTDFVDGENFSKSALIITDSNVEPLYAKRVTSLLEGAGKKAAIHTIPAGEGSKTLAMAEEIFTTAIEAGLDRKSLIVALGGGVVGDIAGFIAATYMRGVPFVGIPTSLLADVDSSVGGKVAVNHALGKNMIGAFYQPKRVFIDTDFLATLPSRELYTGLGEIIKHGVIQDENLFSFIEENAEKILGMDPKALEHLILRSCAIKGAVVTEDEREKGLRQILNFGHTIGHAIEEETGYHRYNHGEAVAIGMIGAAFVSRELHLTDDETVTRLINLIERMNLPTRAEGCTVDGVFSAIFHDKKAVSGRVNWVLMEKIGKVRTGLLVPDEILKRCLKEIL